MKTKLIAGLGLSAFALALAAKDAVIMTVDGVEVPKSEFEYLYHKNSQQQMTPQSIEDYSELFKLYKLKVADARAEGLDTLETFRREMDQYRHDLAAPYLADSTFLMTLLDESVNRAKEEVEAKHIMFFKKRDPEATKAARLRADSVLKVLKAGGNFEELAAALSEDRGSNANGGNMGYISAMRLPYDFETAAYTLAEGEISDIVESPQGYHILKGGKHRPASGKVLASHILIMAQDAAAQEKAKHLSDSIYNIVKADPSKFEDLARRFSDDKGSARQGGKLNWFGRGEMVQEFDSVSFSLPDGAISEPFKTRFGYHIVYRHEHKGAPGRDELKPTFLQMISSGRDPRGAKIRDNQTATLAKKHKGKLNSAIIASMKADAAKSGVDSVFVADWRGKGATEFCVIKGKKYPVVGFMEFIGDRRLADTQVAPEMIEDMAATYYNGLLVDAEEENLLATNPDYANLYREYVDGSLLYEVSLRKVWDKAAKDEAGLERYFQANRKDYRWTEPRAKGYLVQASSDSVADLVKQRAATLGRDSLVNSIRKEFGKEVSIMKVLEAKGASPLIDHLLFGGREAKPTSPRYTTYFMIDPKVISEPEELSDVKGMVTSDYQNVLQEEWEKELKEKYPVKVNEKVLKKVRPVRK